MGRGALLMLLWLCAWPLAASEGFAALLAQSELGKVRVIVQLDEPQVPVGFLSRAQREAQQQQITLAQQRLLERVDRVEVLRRFASIPALALQVDAPTLKALRADPAVVAIHEDRLASPLLEDSVPLIGADTLGALGGDGAGWAVAVLDSGVDYQHEFFAGKLQAEACFSSNYPPHAATSLCPEGASSSTAEGAGKDCVISDYCAHGTHVAGIAVGDREPGFTGVARGGGLVSVQIFSRFDSEAICGGDDLPCLRSYESDQIAALEHVLALHQGDSAGPIAAVNLSLGFDRYELACDREFSLMKGVVDNLRSAGIATVAASGNGGLSGEIAAPACISTVIAVGASDGQDRVADFSNHSELIDLLAPGDGDTPADGIDSALAGTVDGYIDRVGTSMAAPHVAGGWAALRTLYPEASVAELLLALKAGGTVLDNRLPAKPRIDLLATHLLFASDEPALTVLLAPQAARDEGAAWRIAGESEGEDGWLASGEMRSGLQSDTDYTVEFRPLDAARWISPTPQLVTVGEGLALLEARYLGLGSLQVTLAPQEALEAGAAWRRTGEAVWRASGEIEEGVPEGSHRLEFRALTGWDLPPTQHVTVRLDALSVATASYSVRKSGGGLFAPLWLLVLGFLPVLLRYRRVSPRI